MLHLLSYSYANTSSLNWGRSSVLPPFKCLSPVFMLELDIYPRVPFLHIHVQVLWPFSMPTLDVALATFSSMTCCVLGLRQDLLTVQDILVRELGPMTTVEMVMGKMLV